MHVCALEVEVHLPEVGSLKGKRAVIRHLVEVPKRRFGVAAAEVGHQDSWQRAVLGYAAVSGSPVLVEQVLDQVERFVWSHPEVAVLRTDRAWVELEGDIR
jgi:uncharacterized protein YlxP (DUF503 family)